MFTFLAFLVTFSALVLVHEAGHFLAARARGVRVEEFGFGFPPRLWSRKVGQTLYSVNLIPLGGFVRLFGESDASAGYRSVPGSAASDAFSSKSFFEKLFIVLAGVFSNLAFALVALSILLSIGTTTALTHLYPKARVSNPRLVVTNVLPKSPAATAGVKSGDVLLSVAGQSVPTFEALSKTVSSQENQLVAVVVLRRREQMTLSVTPTKLDAVSGRVALGIGVEGIATISFPVLLAPAYAAAESYFISKEMLKVLKSFVGKLFIERTTENLGVTGPIGIAVLSGQVARTGLTSFVYFLALLSLNLALLNVLPLPALDGGRAAILVGERVAGRAIHRKLETALQLVGVALIILLAVLVTVQDLKMFAPMIGRAFGQ